MRGPQHISAAGFSASYSLNELEVYPPNQVETRSRAAWL